MKKMTLTLFLLGILHLPFSCGYYANCGPGFFVNNIADLGSDFGVFDPDFCRKYIALYNEATFRVGVSEIEEVSISSNVPPFFSAAYANDCARNTTLDHELLKIEIISSSTIRTDDHIYEQGTELSELFVLIPSEDASFDGPMEDLIDAINENEDYFSSGSHSIYFQMVDRPLENIVGTFTFTFTFDDRVLSTTTYTITIVSEWG